MAITFPASPADGDKYPDPAVAGSPQWAWVASKGVWDLVTAAPAPPAPATGTPDAPVLSTDLSWTAPADHGSAIIGYEFTCVNNKTVTWTIAPTTYTGAVCQKDAPHTINYSAMVANPGRKGVVSGTTPFTDYTFKVRAMNGNGAGAWSNEVTLQFNFNEATSTGSHGFTDPATPWVSNNQEYSDVPNYNGTGQTWRVRVYDGAGTFSVTQSLKPFRTLVVAGGGTGGGDRGGGGGGGGVIANDSASLSATSHSIAVGAASANSSAFGSTALRGGDGGSYHNGGGQGGNGTFGSGGGGGGPSGGGGAGTPGQGTNGAGGAGFGGGYGGGLALSNNITGSAVTYGAAGAAADWGSSHPTPTSPGAGGYGGRNNPDALGRTSGAPGVVIVAYQIG